MIVYSGIDSLVLFIMVIMYNVIHERLFPYKGDTVGKVIMYKR